jgi:hypothetical protein
VELICALEIDRGLLGCCDWNGEVEMKTRIGFRDLDIESILIAGKRRSLFSHPQGIGACVSAVNLGVTRLGVGRVLVTGLRKFLILESEERNYGRRQKSYFFTVRVYMFSAVRGEGYTGATRGGGGKKSDGR